MATACVSPLTNLHIVVSSSRQVAPLKRVTLSLSPPTCLACFSHVSRFSFSRIFPHRTRIFCLPEGAKEGGREGEGGEKSNTSRQSEGIEGQQGDLGALSREELNKKLYGSLEEEEKYAEIRTEETEKIMENFRAAVRRVEEAEEAMRELERMEGEERERQKEMEKEAEVELAASEEEVSLAENELRAASVALIEARAGLSKETSSDSFGQTKWNTEGVDESAERVESGKCAAISGISGIFIGWPFIFASYENPFGLNSLISGGVVLATCVLFGVTYRYVIRRDLGNTQLKLGAVGAFSLARGLAQIDTTQAIYNFPNNGIEEFLKSCLSAGESVIVLAFSALALDYCLRNGFLEPFPSRKETR